MFYKKKNYFFLIQLLQVQLSGVQECRSDASLRSVNDSAACMVCLYRSTTVETIIR